MTDNIYDHYIAIDWSIKNMAIAHMTKKSNKITLIDVDSDILFASTSLGGGCSAGAYQQIIKNIQIKFYQRGKDRARVVTFYRFPDKGHYLNYTGLIKLAKISGGRSYGKRNPRYSRQLKSVYKSGVLAAIGGNNPINDYSNSFIQDGYAQHNARQKACRRLAILKLGVFKSGKKTSIRAQSNLV